MKILITGYPYVRERYFATFRSWPEPGKLRFLLPTVWTAKEGKVVFHPPADAMVSSTKTLFHHSHVPVIGGLLKGWMPFFPWHLLKHRDVDLVYACSEPTLLTTLYFGVVSKLFGKKFVCFTWENIPYEKKFRGLSRFVHRLILRMNLALTDGLVCGNHEGATIHRQVTRKPSAVIPMNGLDPEQFQRNPDIRPHSQLVGRIVFAFVGALGYRKGLHVALRAFPEVLKKIPSAYLVIAGDGEYASEVDALIEELGLQDSVARFPWLDHHEIARLLSSADVFVYPSIPHKGWAEQFGYSMAEASLMELPVISTKSGSIAEVVKDGETGILVEPDDVQELTHAMIRLGDDEELRKRLGRQGRGYIENLYSHEVIAKKFHAFFSVVHHKS